MATPKVIALTGYGINCDEETKFAFEKAGVKADIVHINDLIDGHCTLYDYQILAFPGGFSYGDDTGSGNAFANKLRNHYWEELKRFVEGDHLAIGICNGFQVMVNLGLVSALDRKYGERQVALIHNISARYMCRWVDLQFKGTSPWTKDLGEISLPIAHGEGNFYADKNTYLELTAKGMVAANYVEGQACKYQFLTSNPNGSLDAIAAIQDPSGRLLGIMPHPERAIEFTQLPNWPLEMERAKRLGLDLPEEGPGLKIFRNGVDYFK